MKKFRFVIVRKGRETYHSAGHWPTAEEARSIGEAIGGGEVVIIEDRTEDDGTTRTQIRKEA